MVSCTILAGESSPVILSAILARDMNTIILSCLLLYYVLYASSIYTRGAPHDIRPVADAMRVLKVCAGTDALRPRCAQ